MSHRIHIPSEARPLFSNIPIESGVTDEEAITSVTPPVSHKTFSRIRITPPNSVSADQLKMVARLAQKQGLAESASVISWVRDPKRLHHHPGPSLLLAKSYSRSVKEQLWLSHQANTIGSTAGKIYLFDRTDSFAYLRPPVEENDAEDDVNSSQPVSLQINSCWAQSRPTLRYGKSPRVFVVLTLNGLRERIARYADSAIEELIGNVETGEHSLTITDDSLRRAHRVFQGIFADARAVAIFDRRAMMVLPLHGRTIRVFQASHGQRHQEIIANSVRLFRRMRRFRVHLPTSLSVTRFLKHRLTYQLS